MDNNHNSCFVFWYKRIMKLRYFESGICTKEIEQVEINGFHTEHYVFGFKNNKKISVVRGPGTYSDLYNAPNKAFAYTNKEERTYELYDFEKEPLGYLTFEEVNEILKEYY